MLAHSQSSVSEAGQSGGTEQSVHYTTVSLLPVIVLLQISLGVL